MWKNETLPSSLYWKLWVLWEFWARKAFEGSWGPKKSQNFKFILEKKVKRWKVVFLQINLALATQNCNKINFRGQKRAKTYFLKAKIKKWGGFWGKGVFFGGEEQLGVHGFRGEVNIYFQAKFGPSILKTDRVMVDVRINHLLGPLCTPWYMKLGFE